MRTDEMLKVQDIHDELCAEIERLKMDVKHALAAYQAQFNEIERLRANEHSLLIEIARLQDLFHMDRQKP